jgi:hypothetical protein
MIFIESAWLAPVGSDVTISLLADEEDSVEQEFLQGNVLWHCTQDDEFRNRPGFGVLVQRRWPQSLGPDTLSGPEEGV